MNVYVLDACALIAYLNQENGADVVNNILFWPIALIIAVFLGLMKVGMKKDFEP